MSHRRTIAIIALTIGLAVPSFAAHKLTVNRNLIVLDGKRYQVLYRDSGDLNADGRQETVFSIRPLPPYEPWETCTLVARQGLKGWTVVAIKHDGYYSLRADVTDVNGDGTDEIVARGGTQDGHGWCDIYRLHNGRLTILGEFHDARFRDLDGDSIPEVLSLWIVGAASLGDHWLTIYKWNGHGYTDVSRRFPRQYDAITRDIKLTIHRLRYAGYYFVKTTPESNPEAFAALYYYLGKSYEYRGLPAKAKVQYAIAYRLNPEDEDIVAAFRRTWKGK